MHERSYVVYNDRMKSRLIGGIVIFVALILSAANYFYTRNKSYSGEIVAKYVKTPLPFSGKRRRPSYYIKIKTEKGKTFVVRVSYVTYSRLKVGDQVEKKKGEDIPHLAEENDD